MGKDFTKSAWNDTQAVELTEEKPLIEKSEHKKQHHTLEEFDYKQPYNNKLRDWSFVVFVLLHIFGYFNFFSPFYLLITITAYIALFKNSNLSLLRIR